MIIRNGYASRNIPNPAVFEEVYKKRIAAKKSGDKVTANALKLVLNTCYGATLNKFNPLYDPLMARSVCVSGQLYLLELAEHLYKDIPDLKVVALNTDSFTVEFDDSQYGVVLEIVHEWEERTGFGLEEDQIETLVQCNVNNYCEVANGSVKVKGGYLVRGIAPAGAFNINCNAVIVATAIREYFVHQTPVEQTINECSDISQFQLIAKAGTKYRESYLLVDGEKRPVQRVNRVYATTDVRYGKLYKVKMADDSEAKIGSLPEHCLIDNSAVDDPHHTSIDQIDKNWYIQQAQDGIDRFLGVEKERKKAMPRTATPKAEEATTTANVYTKLLTARKLFLEEAIKKSGKANKLGYKYFELDDIVPVAIQIFYDLHLLPQVCFSADMATMTIINTDDPSDMITFTSPMANDTGGLISNEIQKLGSVQTYLRRYLYMMALDIVEADQIEASTGMTPKAAPVQPKTAAPIVQKAAGPAVEQPQPKPHAPVTQEQREAIKEELTDADGPADELMLNGLKEAVKKYRLAGGGKHDAECVQYAMETKGFTTATKTRCAEIIKAINTAMKEAK